MKYDVIGSSPYPGYVIVKGPDGKPIGVPKDVVEREAAKEAEKEAWKQTGISLLSTLAGGAAYAGGGHLVDKYLLGKGAVEAPKALALNRLPAVAGEAATNTALAGTAPAASGSAIESLSGIGPVSDGSAYAKALEGESGYGMGSETIAGGLESLGVGPETAGMVGDYAIPVVSTVLGGKGLYDAIKNKDPLGGAMSGAGFAYGLGGLGELAGLSFVPGVGWMVGGGALLGALAAGLLGGDKDMWQTEGNRWDALQEKYGIPKELIPGSSQKLTGGRSKADLVAQALESQRAGNQYANPTFAESRNEADLKPEDTWGYAAWAEQFGPQYLQQATEEQRREANKYALEHGLVNEHHGTIDLNLGDEDKSAIEQILGLGA